MVKWLSSLLSCVGHSSEGTVGAQSALPDGKCLLALFRDEDSSPSGALRTKAEALSYAELAIRYESSQRGVIVLTCPPRLRKRRAGSVLSVYCNTAAYQAVGAHLLPTNGDHSHAELLSTLERLEPSLLADLQAHLQRVAADEPAGALTLMLSSQRYPPRPSSWQNILPLHSATNGANICTAAPTSSYDSSTTAPDGMREPNTARSAFHGSHRPWEYAVVEPARFLATAELAAGAARLALHPRGNEPASKHRGSVATNWISPSRACSAVFSHAPSTTATDHATGPTAEWPAIIVTLEVCSDLFAATSMTRFPPWACDSQPPAPTLDTVLCRTSGESPLVAPTHSSHAEQRTADKHAPERGVADKGRRQSARIGGGRGGGGGSAEAAPSSAVTAVERSPSSFFARFRRSYSALRGLERQGSVTCTGSSNNPASHRADAAAAAAAAETARLREGMVLAGLTPLVTAFTCDGAEVLYQNATSVFYYGVRSTSAAGPNDPPGARPPKPDDAGGGSGGRILAELFSFEPFKLERMLAEVCVDGRVWKGIVQVPISCHHVLSALARAGGKQSACAPSLVADTVYKLVIRDFSGAADEPTEHNPMPPLTSLQLGVNAAVANGVVMKPPGPSQMRTAGASTANYAGELLTAGNSATSPCITGRGSGSTRADGGPQAESALRHGADRACPAARGPGSRGGTVPSLDAVMADGMWVSALQAAMMSTVDETQLQEAAGTFHLLSASATVDPLATSTWGLLIDTPDNHHPHPLTDSLGRSKFTPSGAKLSIAMASCAPAHLAGAAAGGAARSMRIASSPRNHSSATCADLLLSTSPRPTAAQVVQPLQLGRGNDGRTARGPAARKPAPKVPPSSSGARALAPSKGQRALMNIRRSSDLCLASYGPAVEEGRVAKAKPGSVQLTPQSPSLGRDGYSGGDSAGAMERADVLWAPLKTSLRPQVESRTAVDSDPLTSTGCSTGVMLEHVSRTVSLGPVGRGPGLCRLPSMTAGGQRNQQQQQLGDGRTWTGSPSAGTLFGRGSRSSGIPRRCATRTELSSSPRNFPRVVTFASSLRITPSVVQAALQVAVSGSPTTQSGAGSAAATPAIAAVVLDPATVVAASLPCNPGPHDGPGVGGVAFGLGLYNSTGHRCFVDSPARTDTDSVRTCAAEPAAPPALQQQGTESGPAWDKVADGESFRFADALPALRQFAAACYKEADPASMHPSLSSSQPITERAATATAAAAAVQVPPPCPAAACVASSAPVGTAATGRAAAAPPAGGEAAAVAVAIPEAGAPVRSLRPPAQSLDLGTTAQVRNQRLLSRMSRTSSARGRALLFPSALRKARRSGPPSKSTGAESSRGAGAADYDDPALDCLLPIGEALAPGENTISPSRSNAGATDTEGHAGHLAIGGGSDEGGGNKSALPSPDCSEPSAPGGRGPYCWHEVSATRTIDPVTGQYAIILTQVDVTAKVEAERHLAYVTEAEHRLLEQIFPRHVLAYMTEEGGPWAPSTGNMTDDAFKPTMGRNINKLATSHDQVTLLFADIQGFTPMCKILEPRVVMAFLNDLFTRFDNKLDEFGVYKVETIGDCYFVAGGLIHEDEQGMPAVRTRDSHADPQHAERVFEFAKAMLAAAAEVRLPTTGGPVRMRIGIHSGPVVSGVVGQRMPRFCLFGDTVNTTSRMESTGVPGCIHASEAAQKLLRQETWVPTGGIEVKGKGLMDTYLWVSPGADCTHAEVAARFAERAAVVQSLHSGGSACSNKQLDKLMALYRAAPPATSGTPAAASMTVSGGSDGEPTA